MIRLGDGTQESNNKMQNAVELLKDFIDEFFVTTDYENDLLKDAISVDVKSIQAKWQQKVNDVFEEANLEFIPSINHQIGGKNGSHSEHLTTLLDEMQTLQRTYPNSVW